MRLATEHRVPVVPRGAGSGLSGGSAGVEGALTVALTRMNRILEIDRDNLVAVVQPGVINADLKAAVAKEGLFYAPDPASYEFCSIGGNIGTNAGGLCCVKYGVTRDAVLGLEVVLADGRVIRTGGRTVKDVAGYSLTHLFVGSQGTLGIVTEATLRLRPAPPPKQTMLCFLPDHRVRRRRRRAHDPRRRRALHARADGRGHDRRRRRLAQPRPGSVRRGAPAGRVRPPRRRGRCRAVRCRSLLHRCRRRIGHARDRSRWRPTGCARCGAWRSARWSDWAWRAWRTSACRAPGCRSCWPRSSASRPPTTCAAAPSATPATATCTRPSSGTAAIDAAEARAHAACEELYRAAIALGGTVTGEHGIGAARREFLPEQVGADAVDVMRSIKAALDPLGILNPGKVV